MRESNLADAQLSIFLSALQERALAEPLTPGTSVEKLFDLASVPPSFAGVVSSRTHSGRNGGQASDGGEQLTLEDCPVGCFLEVESGKEGEPWYGKVVTVDETPGEENPLTVRWLGVVSGKPLSETLKGARRLYSFQGGEDAISLESVREARETRAMRGAAFLLLLATASQRNEPGIGAAQRKDGPPRSPPACAPIAPEPPSRAPCPPRRWTRSSSTRATCGGTPR